MNILINTCNALVKFAVVYSILKDLNEIMLKAKSGKILSSEEDNESITYNSKRK